MKNMNIIKLDAEFSCFIDSTDENAWNSFFATFRDATINQTMVYGQIRSNKTSNLVLRRNGEVVAMVMTRLITLPFLNAGIAYVSSGPIWRLRGEPDNIDVLRKTVQALKEEYVVQRGLLLRISPNVFTNLSSHNAIRSVFEEEGFNCKETDGITLFLDLDQPLDNIRKGFHPKWRNQLNRAEKNKLTVREGLDDKLFKVFRGIYEEMLARKQYTASMDIAKYEAIQNNLPETLKSIILLCELDGRPMAGAVVSANGDTGVYLLGATSNEGMKCKASYLVQWHVIKMLKERGFHKYDLGGCDPKINPNTYLFKSRICGKKPELFSQIGIMEVCNNPMSLLAVKTGEFLKSLSRNHR